MYLFFVHNVKKYGFPFREWEEREEAGMEVSCEDKQKRTKFGRIKQESNSRTRGNKTKDKPTKLRRQGQYSPEISGFLFTAHRLGVIQQ